VSTAERNGGKAVVCEVFRSPRREGMYLYVDKEEGLARVPPELLKSFGAPQQVMLLALTPERRLARADRAEVEAQVRSQGFFLQLPPGPENRPLRADGR